jgi:RND family efflux transporter MFP subunit
MTDSNAPLDGESAARLARGLRTMGIVRWVLFALVAIVAATTWWKYVFHTENGGAGPDAYYCPMHPQIRSAVPGTCPICFMTLEPIPEERKMPGHVHAPAVQPAPLPGQAPAELANVMLTDERRRAAGVSTSPVTRRSVARELHLPAEIEASEKAVSELRVRSAGFVERVAPIETGQKVQAGQPLVWIYSPEILRAEEELLAARSLRLRGSNAESAGSNDRPATGHELGEDMSAAAEQRLLLLGANAQDIERVVAQDRAERLLPLRAPRAGTVTSRQVVVGTYATPEMALFRLTDLSNLWITATAAREDLPDMSKGVTGRFVAQGSERVHDVTVLLVEPLISTETRAGRVRFAAENADSTLRPGDIGEVMVSLPAREVLLVPRDAVIDVGTFRYVYVEVERGLFAPRVVETGALIGSERVVSSGLEVGTPVVSRGAFLLDSESRMGASLGSESSP